MLRMVLFMGPEVWCRVEQVLQAAEQEALFREAAHLHPRAGGPTFACGPSPELGRVFAQFSIVEASSDSVLRKRPVIGRSRL